MRLRLTIKRNGIPDASILWPIDNTSSPSVYQLLEQVNELFPITTDDEWGLEDYAVEIKGSNGVNYECLHFQPVCTVIKDEDEVIIRPLLTYDLKTRKVSGRHQIAADGKHLIDGVPLGKPLLKRPRGRPAIKIHARKRPKLLEESLEENDDEAEWEPLKAIEDGPAEEVEENTDRQMILHGDFDDEDSENDEDFAPEDEDDDDDDDEDSDKFSREDQDITVDSDDEEDRRMQADRDEQEEADTIPIPVQTALADVHDPSHRAKIRKLHAAFPTAKLALCRYILQGAEYDIIKGWEALSLQYKPESPKIAMTKTSKGKSEVPPALAPEVIQDEDLDEEGSSEEEDDSVLKHYDQHGLPPGSIQSGKALSFMAAAVKGSDAGSFRPHSATSSKRLKFSEEGLSNGFTSTPAIDKESQEVKSSSEDSDSSSSDGDNNGASIEVKVSSDEADESSDESSETSSDSSSDDSSDEEDTDMKESPLAKTANPHPHVESSDSSSEKSSGDDSDVEMENAKTQANGDAESSGSDGNSDSDSRSSDDEAPEVSSNRLDTSVAESRSANTTHTSMEAAQTKKKRHPIPPKQGKIATKARNARRRARLRIQKYKGILPGGITKTEFSQMKLNNNTSLEEAQAQLKEIRARYAPKISEGQGLKRPQEFERARALLLESLTAGGVDVQLVQQSRSRSNSARPLFNETSSATDVPMSEVPYPQPATDAVSSAAGNQVAIKPADLALTEAANINVTKPSTAPEASVFNTTWASPKPAPASVEPVKDAARARRSRLDLGAGKRLLFGALGIKAPKTKADEEKVKTDLMKYARPLKVAKPAEMELTTEDATVDEDPDAWRQKINYRAIECVDEGPSLSEPPFPFFQRWDPSQQRGDRGGKRKQFQRDQSQYYEDTRASKKQKQRKGKQHSYAKELEYLDTSYDPSYQEETELQYDDNTHMEDSPSNGVQDEVSQQLVSEAQTPAADSRQSPDDLASLPQDVSTLPDLKDGEARVGMTVAFKLMEMVNYNPVITPYRTAIIIALQDIGTLQLSLAMRDRQSKEKKYDENGERIYGRFDGAVDSDEEMEEDEEDDGMFSIEYRELYDPKIVQQPPANLGVSEDLQPGETQPDDNGDDDGDDFQDRPGERSEELTTMSHGEAPTQPEQFSHVTETSLNSDGPERQQSEIVEDDEMEEQAVESAEQEPGHQLDDKSVQEQISDDIVHESAPEVEQDEQQIDDLTSVLPDAATPKPATPAREISDDSRKEISTIMRDAGFRSSIPSILRDPPLESMQSPAETIAFEKLRKEMLQTPAVAQTPKSPNFHGPTSSSPVRNEKAASVSPAKPIAEPKSSPPQATQNSWETVDSKYGTPSPEMPQDEPEKEAPSSGWVTEGQSGYPSSPPAHEVPVTVDIEEHPTNLEPEDDGTSGPLGVEQGEPAPFSKAAVPILVEETAEEIIEANDAPDAEVEELVKKIQRAKKLPKKFPVGHAQAAWEMFRPAVRRNSTSSDLSDKDSPSLWVDEPAEKESKSSVLYPKLSGGSSFTSQITDHGRQPEPELPFDDSTMGGGANVFETTDVDMDGPSVNLDDTVIVQHGSAPNPPAVAAEISSDDNLVDIEEDRRPVKFVKRPPPGGQLKHSYDASSDGGFPSLESLSQQARTIKHEPLQADMLNSLEKSLGRKKSATISNMDGNISDESSQSTPKASQKRRKAYENRDPFSNIKKEQVSQSQWRSSQPSASQPLKSQVVDLTLSSDESEDEQIIKPTSFQKKSTRKTSYKDESAKFRRSLSGKDEPAKPTKPNKYTSFSLSDDEDDLFDDAGTGGWKPKKKNTVGGVDARRHTNGRVGLKEASDANRRKTFAR